MYSRPVDVWDSNEIVPCNISALLDINILQGWSGWPTCEESMYFLLELHDILYDLWFPSFENINRSAFAHQCLIGLDS